MALSFSQRHHGDLHGAKAPVKPAEVEFHVEQQEAVLLINIHTRNLRGTSEVAAFFSSIPDFLTGQSGVTLNFSDVQSVGPSIVRTLYELDDSLQEREIKLTICGLSDKVKRAFAITHLDSRIRIDEAEAGI